MQNFTLLFIKFYLWHDTCKYHITKLQSAMHEITYVLHIATGL